MKVPVFECNCNNCGIVRVIALNGAKAPDRCPVCGSPQTYRVKFIEAENLNNALPKVYAAKTGDIKPLPEIKPGMAKILPPKEKFAWAPQPKKRIMQVVIVGTLPQTKSFFAQCADDEGDPGVTAVMSTDEARAKDIRLGDWVEVEGKKIIRVLLEKRGGNNAKEAKG